MAAWKRPAIFGAFDGLTCLLGVLIPLFVHPEFVLRTAIGVGLAEAVGMAAGEWQSESGRGLLPSVVIGASSGAGAIIPALPYGLLSPMPARWTSIALLLLVVGVIAWLRSDERGHVRAFVESYLILAVVVATVWLGGLL